MSIHVTDFKWEKGKNDLKYIELLEKTLKNEQAITAKAVAKIRELSAENKEIRNKTIDEYMTALCDKCLDQKNECYQLECPFCDDGCDIVNIAEKLKVGGENEID